MTDLPPLLNHFWLFCGLFTGVVGPVWLRIKLGKQVAAGQVDRAALNSFTRGWSIAVLAPCLVLWLLGLSSGAAAGPDYMRWDALQKWAAIAVTVACWFALLGWVWLGSGAVTLARFVGLAYDSPAFNKPAVVRGVVAILVATGVVAMGIKLVTGQPLLS